MLFSIRASSVVRDKASPRSEVPAPPSRAFLGGPPVGESRLLAAPPLSPADGDLAPGMAAVDAALPSLLPPLYIVRESSPYFWLFCIFGLELLLV